MQSRLVKSLVGIITDGQDAGLPLLVFTHCVANGTDGLLTMASALHSLDRRLKRDETLGYSNH